MGHCYHVNNNVHDDESHASFRRNQALASFNEVTRATHTRMRANRRRDVKTIQRTGT